MSDLLSYRPIRSGLTSVYKVRYLRLKVHIKIKGLILIRQSAQKCVDGIDSYICIINALLFRIRVETATYLHILK